MSYAPSLRLRLMLIISALIAVLCTACGLYILQRAQQDIRGEVYSATELVEHYLDARMVLARNAWRANPDLAPSLELARLAEVRHVDVYFYNAVGTLLERSGGDAKHVSAAPKWFLWLAERHFTPIPDVRRFVTFDGLAVGMLVIRANPAFELDEIWNSARGVIGLLIVVGLLMNLLVWWAVSRALRPLSGIRAALNELAAGHLQARLPALREPELRSLGDDFNRMAQALERGTLENERLTQRLKDLQAEERSRIARELHDELGQCLTAIHADAVSIRRAAGEQAPIAPSAAAIIEVTARIKTLVRDMLRRLRPAQVQEAGLGAALDDLTDGFRQRNPGTACALQLDEAAREQRGEAADAAYRLVQEALTNAARHAQARRVEISVTRPQQAGAAVLRLRIADDGRGFDTGASAPGLGIRGMRERLRELHGELDIDSRPGAGTCLSASIPA